MIFQEIKKLLYLILLPLIILGCNSSTSEIMIYNFKNEKDIYEFFNKKHIKEQKDFWRKNSSFDDIIIENLINSSSKKITLYKKNLDQLKGKELIVSLQDCQYNYCYLVFKKEKNQWSFSDVVYSGFFTSYRKNPPRPFFKNINNKKFILLFPYQGKHGTGLNLTIIKGYIYKDKLHEVITFPYEITSNYNELKKIWIDYNNIIIKKDIISIFFTVYSLNRKEDLVMYYIRNKNGYIFSKFNNPKYKYDKNFYVNLNSLENYFYK